MYQFDKFDLWLSIKLIHIFSSVLIHSCASFPLRNHNIERGVHQTTAVSCSLAC